MNLDPRQGTLDGFELPLDALALRSERATLGPSGSVVKEVAPQEVAPQDPTLPEPLVAARASGAVPTNTPDDYTPGINTPGANAPSLAPPRRQSPVRQSAARAGSIDPTPDAPSPDALVQTVAELKAALAEARGAAHTSRRQTTWLGSVGVAILLLVLGLGIVQTIAAMRASRESAAAQVKTEALLRAQQTELAALTDAASAAAADLRGAAAALSAATAQPPAVKRAPKIAHRRTKTRRSTAN